MSKYGYRPKLPFLRLFIILSILASVLGFTPTSPRLASNLAITSDLFAIPARRPKHVARARRSNTLSPITNAELAQHVASQYIFGPNGIMKEKAARERNRKGLGQVGESEQKDYLKMLDRHPALVLNADYQPISYLPLSMWHWQEAVKAVFAGKVTVVDVYPGVSIRATNLEIPLPSVIALIDYVQQPNSKPAFTKRNVFLRDEYRCQYCNDRFHTRDLSLDHVHPRSLGGALHWENAVTSCRTCNGRKGSLTVDRLKSVGMKLSRRPRVPTQFQLHSVATKMLPSRVHPTWAPYLGVEADVQTFQKPDEQQQAMYFEDIS